MTYEFDPEIAPVMAALADQAAGTRALDFNAARSLPTDGPTTGWR